MQWPEIVESALSEANKIGSEYVDKLNFELKEIDKQAQSQYWTDLLHSGKKYNVNKNGLVLPFLLKITEVDPIASGIDHNISYQPDFPDIDTDFLPYARDHIKKYASEKYDSEKVCTVGNWNTLKLKQAIQDAARITGRDLQEAIRLTKNLNDEEYEEMTIEELCRSSTDFEIYYHSNKEVINLAMRLKGRIKSQGQHAGGIIISSHKLSDIIPMSYIKGKFVSQWTEGMAAAQLSPFGLVKFDILGLKTMAYNVYAEELIFKSRGLKIDWNSMNPLDAEPYAGYLIHQDGFKEKILFNDPVAIKMADEVKTEAVFQLDTPVAKRILGNGVKSWNDLMVYTAMGRPGPIDMIPEYVARRDDPRERWKMREDKRVVDLLSETFGVVVYQEQLTACWMKFGGLSAPEAEKARKAVAKKKAEEVVKVNAKVLDGMQRHGFAKKYAEDFISKLETFGRYAFNKSHCAAYTIIMYRSLWLKAHCTPEFWASILTYCHPDKAQKYVSVARQEGVLFKNFSTGTLSDKFVVQNDGNDIFVYPSLSIIKGMGKNGAIKYSKNGGICDGLDDFIEKYGKSRTIIERLIKLGAFDQFHHNRKALWMWFLYKYAAKKDSEKEKNEITSKFLPSEEDLKKERLRQENEFKKQFPKKKVPKKIINWMPKIGPRYSIPSINQVLDLFNENEFTFQEILSFERIFLGMYWSSPIEQYIHNPENSFEIARISKSAFVDAVVDNVSTGLTKNGTKFTNYTVNDGTETSVVKIWKDGVIHQDKTVFELGRGIRMSVQWNEDYKTFSMCRNSSIILLKRKEL